MEKKRSFLYPTKENIQEYIAAIENIEDTGLRRLLKTILCTGVRVGEALNGFYFFDADGNMFFQCISAKRRNILISDGHQSKFQGKKLLEGCLSLPYWKRVKCVNLFAFDITELNELAEKNEGPQAPIEFLAEQIGIYNYLAAYQRLKVKNLAQKVQYRRANSDEEAIKIIEIPAFHFYRKLFAAEYYIRFGIASAVEKLKWKNINVFFEYVKNYKED